MIAKLFILTTELFLKMKKLYLLRHAKSGHPRNVDDRERPLNERGLQECKNMNAYLRENNITPSIVLCSPAKRTETTANETLQEIDSKISIVKKLYLATAGEILKELANVDNSIESVMVIAHNPGVQDLALFLAEIKSKKHFAGGHEYPTCALTEFSLATENWGEIPQGANILERFIA